MWTPFVYTLVLILAFSGYLYLCEKELKNGRRLWLDKQRQNLDIGLERAINKLEKAFRYVVRYVITLSWYYSLHAFLKLVLRSLAGVYHIIEAILIRNRDRARVLRKEKKIGVSHLQEIAEHKEAVRLSSTEEKRRKDKALKGE